VGSIGLSVLRGGVQGERRMIQVNPGRNYEFHRSGHFVAILGRAVTYVEFAGLVCLNRWLEGPV